MNETALTLTIYLGWTMLLLLALANYRTFLVMSKQRQGSGLKFNPDGTDLSDFGHRLTRTFANCVESFAFIGGVMLLALATGHSSVTDGLAFVLLGARFAQSIVHLISSSNLFIQLRFAFFLVQFGICAYWLVLLAQIYMGNAS